jgi:hypothetical protein
MTCEDIEKATEMARVQVNIEGMRQRKRSDNIYPKTTADSAEM